VGIIVSFADYVTMKSWLTIIIGNALQFSLTVLLTTNRLLKQLTQIRYFGHSVDLSVVGSVASLLTHVFLLCSSANFRLTAVATVGVYHD